MSLRRFLTFALVPMFAGLVMGAGCIFDPGDEPDPEPVPEQILPRTSEGNLIRNLQVIYNDKARTAIDRQALYEQQIDTGSDPNTAFIFKFQPADIAAGLPPSWGSSEELTAHRAIFEAQESGEIYSLELRIIFQEPAIPLDPPEDLRPNWTEIFASNVYLRLMFNAQDGLEVNGGQAEFKFAPAVNGLFVINEWEDRPRPVL